MACQWLRYYFLTLGLACLVTAYEVPIVDTDYSRQICSGMWGGQSAYINVTFDKISQGHLATVIYEWSDMKYLGKVTSRTDDSLPKTYVCTTNAVSGGFCDQADLGRFILDLPAGKSVNDTSFWSARVDFSNAGNTTSSSSRETSGSSNSFWDNPKGNPTPPSEAHAAPWRRAVYNRRTRDQLITVRQPNNTASPNGVYLYKEPIHYRVLKTGYYCLAVVPVTVLSPLRAPSDLPFHPSYKGTVLFRNTFDGKLPATDYPKINFYFVMFLIYAALGGVWFWTSYKNQRDLLPIQPYLSSLVGLLVIEMVANWAYYRYVNAHGRGTASTVFLFVVAILDAGKNALSFFMLLVVSLGLSVVRESLGRTMIKCRLLAVAHFIFGVLYAVGIVELELESTSALVLLPFVVPLAFTLSGFLMWILYALNATITQLRIRKQRYKLTMFERLYRVLLFTVIGIIIFFVVSTLSFSGRLAEDYAAKSWKVRWWLLDGWLALLYFVAFSAIAYLWRPSPNNAR